MAPRNGSMSTHRAAGHGYGQHGRWVGGGGRHVAAASPYPPLSGGPRLKCIVLGAAGAGKTSILRRFVHGTFTFEGGSRGAARASTVGADFYTKRVPNPMRQTTGREKDDDGDVRRGTEGGFGSGSFDDPRDAPYVGLQLWDTAGRERQSVGGKKKKKGERSGPPRLGDAFFRHADAALLVYDATSGVSFLQLMQWHAELTRRVAELDGYAEDDSDSDDGDEDKDRTTRRRPRRRVPVLVVANKLDRIRVELSKPLRPAVSLRDVMGLTGEFRGRDSRYEYTARQGKCGAGNRGDDGRRSRTRRRKPHNHQRDGGKRNEESLSYALTDSEWSTDYNYLKSVMSAEDGSLPQREMVLLWCMRNQINHIEVSALDGTGVDEAMDALVVLALEAVSDRKRAEREAALMTKPRHHHNLDLHARYAREDKGCCWGYGLRSCRK